MARTVAEIKKQMTEAFVLDNTIREKYGITEGKTFEETFSKVSVESTIFYVVAVAVWTLETLFDLFKADVDEKISRAVVASVAWYYKMARRFQYGDALVFDEQTQGYGYVSVDEKKQVVKYAAIRDRGGSIQVLVSGDAGGKPTPLSEEVLTAFKFYMNRVKIAGVILSVKSVPADRIRINATVQIDPMLMDTTGKRLSDGGYPVVSAIDSYLANIVYGGNFNKTKLVDAIQGVAGVADVTLGQCSVKVDAATEYAEIKSNNYTADSGCFIADSIKNTVSYVV